MTPDIRLWRWTERDRESHERLAGAISRLRALVALGRGEVVASALTGPEEPDDADRARALLMQRRNRNAAAGSLAELFGEPGWDLLLILFVAYEDGRVIDGRTLLAEAGIRPAVGRRWLAALADRGLIHCGPHAPEARPVALTDEGVMLTLRCIAAA